MVVQGITFCDLCGDVIFPEDLAPVKIEVKGQFHRFEFHNRNSSDCLAQKLSELKEKFKSESIPAPSH